MMVRLWDNASAMMGHRGSGWKRMRRGRFGIGEEMHGPEFLIRVRLSADVAADIRHQTSLDISTPIFHHQCYRFYQLRFALQCIEFVKILLWMPDAAQSPTYTPLERRIAIHDIPTSYGQVCDVITISTPDLYGFLGIGNWVRKANAYSNPVAVTYRA